jgi:hypothetical protein
VAPLYVHARVYMPSRANLAASGINLVSVCADALWIWLKHHVPAVRISDVNRHIWTSRSHGITSLQKSKTRTRSA